ncbi:MAG: ABC transporter ATP-binding protein, partial [Actinomycetota bacterium]
MRNAPAYEVRGLVKRYSSPSVLANDGISFQAVAGEAFGLLGPNGAGKSTLGKQLVGLLTPTSGEVRLFGETVRPHVGGDRRIGRTVAYLPQGTLSLGELKVHEAIRWTGMLRGLGKAQAANEADELLEILSIGELHDRQTRKLSGGQRRLVHLAMTFIARLPVLILDEPTADIDIAHRQTVWDLISERCSAGATVILVTHDVAEAERALQRVAIVDQGKVVVGGTPAELKARLAHRTRLDIVVAESSTLDPKSVAADVSDDVRI